MDPVCLRLSWAQKARGPWPPVPHLTLLVPGGGCGRGRKSLRVARLADRNCRRARPGHPIADARRQDSDASARARVELPGVRRYSPLSCPDTTNTRDAA